MADEEEPPPVMTLHNAAWWTPHGLGDSYDAAAWREEQAYASCPYYISQNGGPAGICDRGCHEYPICMDLGPGVIPATVSDG